MKPEARGVIPPDQADIDLVNSLRGSIRQSSKLVRGAGFALGFGTSALTLAACARPDQAQVQPAPQQSLDLERAMAVIAAATAEAEKSPAAQSRENLGIEFALYELKDRPYQIAYPRDWAVLSHPGSGLEGGVDRFSDPNSSSQEQLQRSISVFYVQAAPGDTLDYLAQNLKELSVKHNKKNGGTDFNPQQKPFNVAGYPAILTSIRYAQSFGVELETRIITFIAGDKVWDITLSTSPQELDKTMPIFEEMLKRFKLNESQRATEVPRAFPVLLPIHISEELTPDFKVTEEFRREKKLSPLEPEPGWKYIYIEFAVENRGQKADIVKIGGILTASILHTKEGFQYKDPVRFDYSGIITNGIFNPTQTYFGDRLIPPGFRIRGVFDGSLDYRFVHPSPNDTNAYTNRVAFRMGEKTSPTKLIIPGLPELDLTKGAVNINSLKFPTDKPDSDFKNPGTTINIPGKGSVTFENVVDRTYQRDMTFGRVDDRLGTKVKIRFRFHNESIGQGQTFDLAVKIFGEDGILYTATNSRPNFQDGYFVSSGEVPPVNDKAIDVEIVTSSTIKGGKLMVSGDINEIFNVVLPAPNP